jgi:hypothetical protein
VLPLMSVNSIKINGVANDMTKINVRATNNFGNFIYSQHWVWLLPFWYTDV